MSLILRAAVVSDRGLARENNEDAAHAGSWLVAVADGIGGLPGGEVASEIAIQVLAELDVGDGVGPDSLRHAIDEANRRIRDTIDANPQFSGMGTTATALLLAGNRLTLAHVGDSRAYLWRDGRLSQLSRDDTYVQALVDRGAISAREASVHPHRSLVTRAVQGEEVAPACTTLKPRVDDRYLLCSDGLSDVVTDDAIGAVLGEVAEPSACAQRLIALALDAGGPDNITAVVADVADV